MSSLMPFVRSVRSPIDRFMVGLFFSLFFVNLFSVWCRKCKR